MSVTRILQEGEAAVASSVSLKTETSIRAEVERGFWSELPEDLIFKILYGLPIKDLFALKFVSKDWNFVISKVCIPWLCPPFPYGPFWGFLCFKDPLPPPPPIPEKGRDHDISEVDKYLKLYFIDLYKQREGIFIYKGFWRYTMEDYFLPLLPEERDASKICDCCNGLLLLASKNSQYYVANPFTKQRILVPKISHHPSNNNNNTTKTIHSSLVFDPSLSLGFKIVSCIRPAEDATVTHPMEFDIFCSDTKQWSRHVLPLEPYGLYGFEWLRRSVYFNGALFSLSLAMYLVCIDNLIPRPSRNTGKDYHGVKAWAIELPDKDDVIPSELLPNCCGCIGVSSGRFYYSNRDAQGCSMFVWRLVSKGKNSEWVLIHTIRIAVDLEVNLMGGSNHVKHWKHLDCFRPRAFLPRENTIIIASPQLLISYQLKTKLVDTLWRYHPLKPCNRKTLQLDGNWIFPFSPCLLLLKSMAAGNSKE